MSGKRARPAPVAGKPAEMTVTMEREIRERLADLEAGREVFVREANERLAGYNGAIGELKRLLEEPQKAQEPASQKPVEKEPEKEAEPAE